MQRLALQTKVEKRTPEELEDYKRFSQPSNEESIYAIGEAFRIDHVGQIRNIASAPVVVAGGEGEGEGTEGEDKVERDGGRGKGTTPGRGGKGVGRGRGRGKGEPVVKKDRSGDANIVRRWRKEDLKKDRPWVIRHAYQYDEEQDDEDEND